MQHTTNRRMKKVLGALWLTAILTVPAQAQDFSAQPPRARQLLKNARDLYSKGEYDAAAQAYAQVESVKETLTATERADLGAQMQQNAVALKGRQDGLALVESAEALLAAGKVNEAEAYLRYAHTNQFLSASAADRQRVQTLSQNINKMRGVSTDDAKGNTNATLLRAREALKRGDLDMAEALARQAEKQRSLISGLAFWGDTPTRVLDEVRVARSKMPKKDVVVEVEQPVAKAFPPGMAPSTAMDNTSNPGKANVANASPLPALDRTKAKEQAKQLVLDGYKALEANDFDQAKSLANRAKELHAELEWWEPNPDKLLADVGRRTATNEVVATSNDPAALLRQGRQYYQQQRYDEAEKIASMAEAHNRRYGLFEDSPKKLKDDIARSRGALDSERANKLTMEARRQLKQNNFAEARNLANEAKKLNSANNSFFGWNDTPDAVLRDVARLERTSPPQPNFPQTPADVAPTGVAQAGGNNLESAELRRQNKTRASNLVAEARLLERQEHLVEARTKALDAQKIAVQWAPTDDTPEAVLRDLSTKAAVRVHTLLEQATELASNNPADTTRFQKADNYLLIARRLAEAFRQDTSPIDRKAQWLQQASNQSRNGAIASAPALQSAQGARPGGLEEPSEPAAKMQHQEGLKKLEQARLELAAGNTKMARDLAVDAFAVRSLQSVAQSVLVSIDDEENRQKQVTAEKNYQAGMYYFQRKDYRKAAELLATVDVTLLHPDNARKLGEVISSRDMHGSLQPAKDNSLANSGIQQTNNVTPGVSSINDRTDPQMEAVKAMEKVIADKYRDMGLAAQQRAMDLAKAGKKTEAVEVLRDFQVRLKDSKLSDSHQANIDRPIDSRIKSLQTAMAQEDVEKERKKLTGAGTPDMGERTLAKIKLQEQIADLCNRGNQRYKEGQYAEAIACANKALELDPECTSAQALKRMSDFKGNLANHEKIQEQQRTAFLEGTSPDIIPGASYKHEVNGDKQRALTAKQRPDISIQHNLKKTPTEMMIERKLLQPTQGINFLDVPLYRVLQDLQAMSGLNIVPDKAALAEKNVSLEQPISLQVENVSLKAVLNLILRQARLTYVIRNEVLEVTTNEQAEGKRKVLTYSVADLVVPVDDHGTSPINSFEEALKRHVNSANGGVRSAPPTPIVPQGGLQSGTPVSQNGPGGAGWTSSKSNSATIENLVINLITSTIAPNSWEQAGGEGRIQYFPLGHALVISQVQEVQEEVQALLNALRKLQDIQISIEMRVVSVSEKFFERIGLDFDVNFKSPTYIAAANQLQNGIYGPATGINRNLYVNPVVSGLTPAGTLTPDLGVPIKNSSIDFTIPPFGGYPGTLGADGGLTLGMAFLSDIQVFMLLEAAQGDQRTHIMQAPKITVFNGQTANIAVQDQLFFLTSIQVAQAGAQTFFVPQQQPFPIGVGMQVTPVVSADRRFVRLNLVPQITNLISANIPLIPVQVPIPQLFDAPGGQGYISGQPVIFQMFFQQPSFTNITINTTVNVPDGGTVLLGGLKTLAEGRNEFGPPILSKIPYINRLFRNQAFGREAQSVMVMVTPRIIINEEVEQEILGNISIPR